MNELTVFYDEQCELCRRCRDWLRRQPTYVALSFIPLQSPMAERRLPMLASYRPDEEILVVSDTGGVYRGGDAWLMCLWATRTYREWSLRLKAPVLYPLVRKFVTLISHHRLSISSLLSRDDEADIAANIEAHAEVFCDDGVCAPPQTAAVARGD
ncbi:MAG: DUF393 domain-containing protein [Myxococcota bacterium]